jgi:uncharacterized YigZ family protein
MERRLIPAQETRSELRVLNSRFVASLAPTFSVEAARAFVARIRAEFPDASHHIPAYLIGHGRSVIAHCHDDGEPAGTAGRPALAVLQGSGLGDVTVVVTRYFGGTKLGTGGLVRAYGDAVRSVLEVTPRAVCVATHTVRLTLPYPLYERAQRLIEAHRGQLLEADFAAAVTLTARFVADDLPAFEAALQELTGGQSGATVIASDPETIMPLTS